MDRRPSPLLAQLLAATAALAGPAHAQSDPAAGASMSFRHGDYDEDALETAPLDGSDRRYRVRTEQFRLETPLFAQVEPGIETGMDPQPAFAIKTA